MNARKMGQLLATLCTGNPSLNSHVRALTSSDLADFLIRVRIHRLQGLLADRLDPGLVDSNPSLAALKDEGSRRLAAHMSTLADLRRTIELLGDNEIPYATFKGPVLAEHAYGDPIRRPYGDLDIVVPRSDFRRAIEALEGAGFTTLDQNWELLARERRSQLHVATPFNNVVDIHWHLLNRGTVRTGFTVDMRGLFARTRSVRLAGFDVMTLDATDTVLHLCLHTTLSGGRRLLWYCDIAAAIRRDSPDWGTLVDRAHQWKAGAVVRIALRRAMATAHAAVPDDVLSALRGGLADGAVQWMDRLWPPQRSGGSQDPAGWTAAVTRDDAGSTFTAFRRRALRPTRRLRGCRARGGREYLRRTNGAGGRAAYFDFVGGPCSGSAKSSSSPT